MLQKVQQQGAVSLLLSIKSKHHAILVATDEESGAQLTRTDAQYRLVIPGRRSFSSWVRSRVQSDEQVIALAQQVIDDFLKKQKG